MAKIKDEFEDELDTEFKVSKNREEDEMFDDTLEKEEKEEMARRQPVSVKRIVSNQEHKPLPQRSSPIEDEQTAARVKPSENKFSLYSLPERIGIMDSEENKPVFEAQDATSLIMVTLVSVLNQLDRIERNLNG